MKVSIPMQSTNQNSKYVMVAISRKQETSVIIKLPPGQEHPTEPQIRAAIEKTVDPTEWDSGPIHHGARYPMLAEEAEEFHYYDPLLRPTFAIRAAQIGVSAVTLRKWRDQHGVDVYDDSAVKAHVSKQRNHNWNIDKRFKASL